LFSGLDYVGALVVAYPRLFFLARLRGHRGVTTVLILAQRAHEVGRMLSRCQIASLNCRWNEGSDAGCLCVTRASPLRLKSLWRTGPGGRQTAGAANKKPQPDRIL